MGPRTIIVDGYNVIRNIPGLIAAERVSLQDGREALLKLIAARYRHTPHRITVVFDGNGEAESITALPGLSRGQVVYSQRGESADRVIQRLSAQEQAAGAECVVVSNDIEVRSGVETHGAKGAPVSDLAQRLNEPTRYQRRQYQYRAYLRQQWEKDSDGKGDDEWTNRSFQKKRQKRRMPPDDNLLH